jgi:DNA helicase-2/ATP-dependent DNA helicase PcrA
MKLNPSQAAVVATRERRILVLAGAGTGKTATSVHWVAELIRSGVPRRAILMITFTRKAANEMASRLEGLTKQIPKQSPKDAVMTGTYHAVASLLFRADAAGFGLLNNAFTTLDESESQSIWKAAFKQAGIETKSALHVPGKLQSYYSLARNTIQPVEGILEPLYHKHTARLVQVIERYEELKRAANVVDYDDLLVRWVKRLQDDPAYAQQLRGRWSYVLVDEMQDNNRLNQAILDALDADHLMVVGDFNQSIYSFRGSDVQLIAEFPQKHADAKVLKLENNYRSGQAILDLANTVVKDSPAALHLHSDHGANSQVDYYVYPGSAQEAEDVVRWIKNRLHLGFKPADTAVLARSSRALTALEVGLNYHKIRYKKYGGLTLADAAEVRDFIAFLKVSHNPHDKISLLRALTQFPGVGEGTAAKLIAEHDGGLFGETPWPYPASNLLKWSRELREIPTLGGKGRHLFEQMKELLVANYAKDGEERLGTLNALVNSMEAMNGSLPEFLDGFSLSRSTDDFHPHDAVVLSTIHSAKGLEWDGVWLVSAGAMQMPHPRTLETGEVEEERRLFYVAVTRAKHHLVISYPEATDRRMNQGPTPFAPPLTPWKYRL